MKKVIIIGGGVAGLTAGKRLVDSGKFEVRLLEADSRIGGRVYSRPLGDHFIEGGAQWVHGEEGNSIFNLISPLKLLDLDECDKVKFSSDSVFVTNTGKELESTEHEKVSLILGKILDGPEENEVEGCVGKWAKNKFEQNAEICSLQDSMDKDTRDAVVDWIHRFHGSIDGSDNWFQTSLRGQHEYWECDGNPTVAWTPPACYASLFGVILGNVPNLAPTFQPELPNWIELGKEVEKIELSTDQNKVSVTCSDNSKYEADHVICTVSLGVLKQLHSTMFLPPLPTKKVSAIEHLGIGCVDKFHFDFGTRWWPDTVLGFNFLWEDTERVAEYWRSDIGEATLRQEINGIPIWCRCILGFYRVASHPTALNSWLTGPAALLVEKLSDEEVKRHFMVVLRIFVRNYEIPNPVGFCRSSWFSNPYTRGSYSFRRMESERQNVWASDLAEPVMSKSRVPLLCFAGEATHSHYFSTVHGAYDSGVRESDRLIKHNAATTGS